MNKPQSEPIDMFYSVVMERKDSLHTFGELLTSAFISQPLEYSKAKLLANQLAESHVNTVYIIEAKKVILV